MKKLFSLVLAVLFFIGPVAKADEGMWLLMLMEQQNYQKMKKQGLKLTAKQIYDINNASLKDAIIQFGRGCTGEIVSSEGLILTNHHCGYGQIQAHSTVEHDYLSNGFWAYSKDQELPNPGLTATFLVRMEDVTAEATKGVDNNTEETDRERKIAENIEKIKEKAIAGTHYTARIVPMFEGNQYVMFIYEVFKDVRLVGAPPSSIGKFGSDTDNWMWPRHTCDFSVFRVYADKNGKPAEYSKDNVPLKPKHFLPISLKGVEENDFVMVLGFPGTTERFMPSMGVRQAIDVYNPSVVTARTALRNVMDKDMKADPKVRIQYASKFAQLSNYWKFYIGQTKCLNDLDVYSNKKALENRLAEWINANPNRKQEYGSVLQDLTDTYEKTNPYDYLKVYTNEAIFRGAAVFTLALHAGAWEKLWDGEPNDQKVKETRENLEKAITNVFKDYNLATEEKLFAAGLEVFFRNVPIEQQPKEFLSMAFQYHYDFNAMAEDIFKKSTLVTEEKVRTMLAKGNAAVLKNDPVYQLAQVFLDNYRTHLKGIQKEYAKQGKAQRLFEKAVMEMDNNKHFAPDANSTIRYTFGKVKNYSPIDGVLYKHSTTLDGVIAKDDPTVSEFAVPEKLKELYAKKDFGQYAYNGTVPVCFISDLDITGGNSGSPTINARGELVGLAFDGNWEAMSGNIAFNPDLQRCISVDIRYVLFIIDKYAGAKNLINEMKIVK